MTPGKVSFDEKIVKISCGGHFTAVLLKNKEIWGWGSNKFNQLRNRTRDSKYPILVMDGKNSKTTNIACGFSHILVSYKNNVDI